VIGLSELAKTLESMKSYKETIITYLNMLNALKSKINFGKDEYSLKIEFGWKDVLKNEFYYSYNVNMDYYSALFNLAVLYNLMGTFYIGNDDDTKLKEGIKYFQHAAWVFDKIKQEFGANIPVKEIQPDMSENYLSYCSYLCLARAQSLLYEVAEKKGMNLELRAQLAKGIFDLYTSAYNLAAESLKKLIDENCRAFLNNRRFYFSSLACLNMKKVVEEQFNKTGEGYGKMIAYLGLAVDCMNAGSKDLNKAQNYFDVNKYNKEKAILETQGQEMLEKNQRIYFDSVPDMKTLPKVEKIIKVAPTMIPDDLNKSDSGSLDSLVPREVRPMIANYKQSMMEYISEGLDKYENEGKITAFLAELNLPGSLESAISNNEVSDYLWKRISEVQQKGGSLYLTNAISSLEKKAEDVSKRIADMELILYNEEEEDNKYRNLYGNRWQRAPSKNLNYMYYQVLYEYKSN
jgi:hypothetical protein